MNKRSTEIIKNLLEEQKNIEKEFDKLRLNLITISGGMISITTALNKNSEIPLFIKLGLVLLSFSMIYGFLSIYNQLKYKSFSSLEMAKSTFELEKKIKFKSEGQNEFFSKEFENIINESLNKEKKEVNFLNKLNKILTLKNLDFLKLQFFLFLIGILSLILGVIFKFNLKIFNFITL